MSGALQAVFQNQRSFGLSIGDAYEGGFYAGQISTAGNGIADYNLVVGPKASCQVVDTAWKTTNTTTSGTTSVINGPANSAAMNNASHPAAQFCEALSVGSKTDWYLPAKNELEVCYFNLKPSASSNNTSYGINANAVPARASNYTSGNPAQTSAADFATSVEGFNTTFYWSSTEYDATYGWVQAFSTGLQAYAYKNSLRYVRAVRRVAV